MWQWTSLLPDIRARPLTGITILWCTDQTRALIVPLGAPGGAYTLTFGFEGNIGAEIACITTGGTSVTESASLTPIQLGPYRPRIPVGRASRPSRSARSSRSSRSARSSRKT
jgi:hypothetical protein